MKDMKSRQRKILAFAREAGGAAAIAPVCKEISKEGWDLLLLSKDHGLGVFERNDLPCVEFPSFSLDILKSLTLRYLQMLPDIIFTSATSLPTLDMTERYLWQWGRDNSITTIGVLDQWQNYALRFSGPTPDERLTYMPDYIFVMDEIAKTEMIGEGIPEDKIIITGQPAFDTIREGFVLLYARVPDIKTRLNIRDMAVVTFVAESLQKDFGDTLGYDEQSTLNFVGDTLEKMCHGRQDKEFCLIIKLHPENSFDEFNWVFSKWPSFIKLIIEKELSPYETIAIADIVVGMTSVMLIESIIADKPTVSLQINSLIDSQLVATKTGAIPFIKTHAMGAKILESLLCNHAYMEKYLKSQRTWGLSGEASIRCMKIMRSILQEEGT
jgi:hypothetical protein